MVKNKTGEHFQNAGGKGGKDIEEQIGCAGPITGLQLKRCSRKKPEQSSRKS